MTFCITIINIYYCYFTNDIVIIFLCFLLFKAKNKRRCPCTTIKPTRAAMKTRAWCTWCPNGILCTSLSRWPSCTRWYLWPASSATRSHAWLSPNTNTCTQPPITICSVWRCPISYCWCPDCHKRCGPYGPGEQNTFKTL